MFKLKDKYQEEYTMAAEQHVAGLRVAPNDSGILTFRHKETNQEVRVHRIDGQGWLDNKEYELVGGTPKAQAPAIQLHQETTKQKQLREALEAQLKEAQAKIKTLEEKGQGGGSQDALVLELQEKVKNLEAAAVPGGQDALVAELQAELASIKGILTDAQVKKLAKAVPAEGGK